MVRGRPAWAGNNCGYNCPIDNLVERLEMTDKEKQPEPVTPQQQVSLQDAPIEALLSELGRLQEVIAEIKAEIIGRTKGK